MHPLDQSKRDRKPEIWAPEPLQIPANSPLRHREQDDALAPTEKPTGSYVVVIDIS